MTTAFNLAGALVFGSVCVAALILAGLLYVGDKLSRRWQ